MDELRQATNILNALDSTSTRADLKGVVTLSAQTDVEMLKKIVSSTFSGSGVPGASTRGIRSLRLDLLKSQVDVFQIDRVASSQHFKLSISAAQVFSKLTRGLVCKGKDICLVAEILDFIGEAAEMRGRPASGSEGDLLLDTAARAALIIESYALGKVQDQEGQRVGVPGVEAQGLVELLDTFKDFLVPSGNS
jgi:hypothetical protein